MLCAKGLVVLGKVLCLRCALLRRSLTAFFSLILQRTTLYSAVTRRPFFRISDMFFCLV